MVSEADRIKVAERVRDAIAPIFGGSPSWKRRRGIYRALARGDVEITARYNNEAMHLALLRGVQALMLEQTNNFAKKMIERENLKSK